jgi:hypothetical protein
MHVALTILAYVLVLPLVVFLDQILFEEIVGDNAHVYIYGEPAWMVRSNIGRLVLHFVQALAEIGCGWGLFRLLAGPGSFGLVAFVAASVPSAFLAIVYLPLWPADTLSRQWHHIAYMAGRVSGMAVGGYWLVSWGRVL